jgi:hypothetical protein
MSADDPLDPLLAAVREEVRARADSGGRVRDFAAMIARAHALDRRAVPDDAVAEATQFAPVVALRVISSVPEDRSERPRGRAGGLAVACAVVLLVSGLVGAVRMARDESGPAAAHATPLVGSSAIAGEASAGARQRPDGGSARQGAERGAGPPEGASPSGTSEHGDQDRFEEADLGVAGHAGEAPECPSGHGLKDIRGQTCGEAQEAREAAAGAGDGSGRAGPPARSRDSGAGPAIVHRGSSGPAPPTRGSRAAAGATGETTWAALDRAAREAWRRGDVEEARALLTALVRSDADASRVELAYGDLFVLTRRAGDAEELARLWGTYLALFPRGLYAEDARAGLCRRAAGAQRRVCWDLYLETWPEGAHSGEAREAM